VVADAVAKLRVKRGSELLEFKQKYRRVYIVNKSIRKYAKYEKHNRVHRVTQGVTSNT
jgi:hypothetical protein